jgi:DNA-binding GntR family transcriptional regulator
MTAQPVSIETPSFAAAAPTTLRSFIQKTVRVQILDGTYKPGDRLNESRLAREFNTSRIPVREALSQLQEQGLVMSLERRGMFVIKLSETEVQQINSMRIILEAEAMKLARANLTPAILAELEDLLQKMDAWDGPLADAAALDRHFHAVIWRAAGNPYLERTLDALTTSLVAHKTLEHVTQEVRRWRLSHHRDLLDYVAGNGADPQHALLTHLRMAYAEPEKYSSLVIQDT